MREVDRSREGVKIYTGVNVECFLYINSDGNPCAVGYKGKRDKSSFHYRYRNIENAFSKINDFIMAAKEKAEEEKLWKIEDAAIKKELFSKVEVGSIFVSSWGYDQTNVDAYQVLEKKGAVTLVLKQIGLKMTRGSHGNMSCDVIPVKDSFRDHAEPFEKRINRFGISLSSFETASLWDGKSDYYKSWYA